jgi:hypothetical protein
MEFFDDLSVPVKFVIAFVVALAVLGVGGYLMRRFSGGNLAALGPRGRQPRLAVIDAASVDGSRRLVLVRRDNVEHLLLIGGPTDVVIEPSDVIAHIPKIATIRLEMRDCQAKETNHAREVLRLDDNGGHCWGRYRHFGGHSGAGSDSGGFRYGTENALGRTRLAGHLDRGI